MDIVLRSPSCAPPLLPGSPHHIHSHHIHTFIVNRRIPRFWTQYTELQLQFLLLGLPHPRRTQTGRIGVWTSAIEILIPQTLLTYGFLRPPINCLKSTRINPSVSNLKFKIALFGWLTLWVEPPSFLKKLSKSVFGYFGTIKKGFAIKLGG